jgi:hypothetical protein
MEIDKSTQVRNRALPLLTLALLLTATVFQNATAQTNPIIPVYRNSWDYK